MVNRLWLFGFVGGVYWGSGWLPLAPAAAEVLDTEAMPHPEIVAAEQFEEAGAVFIDVDEWAAALQQRETELENAGEAAPSATVAQVETDTIRINVTGEEGTSPTPESTTGTRTETPLRDVPQSIQVVPQEVLEEQRPLDLRDALRNVSGVGQGNTVAGPQSFRLFEGFSSSTFCAMAIATALTFGATCRTLSRLKCSKARHRFSTGRWSRADWSIL